MENGIHFDGEQGRGSANEVVPSDRRKVRSGQSRDELRHCREKCSAKGYSITSLARAQGQWHREAERLGGLKIDQQLVLGWRLHRQLARPFAPQDAIDI